MEGCSNGATGSGINFYCSGRLVEQFSSIVVKRNNEMRLAHLSAGPNHNALAEFDASVLAGNVFLHDAWMFVHVFSPFCVSFLYSFEPALILIYVYESVIVLLHVFEHSLRRENESWFYPYAGVISALVQDPLQGGFGAILGSLCAQTYGKMTRQPPFIWGIFALICLAVCAVLAEIFWEPSPTTGAFILFPLFVYFSIVPGGIFNRHFRVMLLVSIYINICCLLTFVAGMLVKKKEGGIPPSNLVGIGAQLEELTWPEALSQCGILYVLLLYPLFFKLLKTLVPPAPPFAEG